MRMQRVFFRSPVSHVTDTVAGLAMTSSAAPKAPTSSNFSEMTQAMQQSGENRSPIQRSNFSNAQFSQTYARSQQMSAAGKPVVLRPDGSPVPYKCRPWSSPPVRSPAVRLNHSHPAMVTEPPQPWTPVTGLRPGSAHEQSAQSALRAHLQSAPKWTERPPAGREGPRSFTAWRPPSLSTSKRPVRPLSVSSRLEHPPTSLCNTVPLRREPTPPLTPQAHHRHFHAATPDSSLDATSSSWERASCVMQLGQIR